MNKLLISFVLFAFVGFWSCSSGTDQIEEEVVSIANNDTKLGLIDSDVTDDESDVLGAMPTYSTAAPGTSEKMERAFENAPPMIPHNTEGLVPIKKSMNMCLTCHMPEVAVAMKSVAIPISHMTNYRPEVDLGTGTINIDKSKEITQTDLDGKLSNAVYNCTQCHVPQANVDVAIQNTFDKVYRNIDSKNSSNLGDNRSEGIK